MIKMAYSLIYGSSVDWEKQRDNFVQTAVQDERSRMSRAIISSDNANEDEMLVDGNDDEYDGNLDDALDGDTYRESWLRYAFYTTDGNDDAYDGELDDTLDGEIEEEEFSVDGNDDAYDGGLDDTLSSDAYEARSALESDRPHLQTSRRRQLQGTTLNNIDGQVFDAYEYSKGACPNVGALGVPCAPDNISSLCNKYDRENGSFKSCLDACAPAFCCIHDAPREENDLSPNCNADENCPQYNYCYIAWWKLHDTVGPALFLKVEQDDDFYDVEAKEIQGDSTGNALYTQVLLHHFDDIEQVIADGTVETPDGGSEFNADRIFLNKEYWSYPVVGKVDIGDGSDGGV